MNPPIYIDQPPHIQPELPVDEIQLPGPPEKPEASYDLLIQVALPILTIGGYVLMGMLGGNGRNPLFLIPLALSVVASTAFSIYSFRKERQRQRELEKAEISRENFLIIKIYSVLLNWFLKDLYHDFGPQMVLTFRDQCHERYIKRGYLGIFLLGLSTVVDFGCNAIVEWWMKHLQSLSPQPSHLERFIVTSLGALTATLVLALLEPDLKFQIFLMGGGSIAAYGLTVYSIERIIKPLYLRGTTRKK